MNFDYAQVPRPVPRAPQQGPDLAQPQSPLGDGAQLGFSAPDMWPGASGGAPPNIGQRGVANPGISAWAGGRTCIFEINRKVNNLLFVFTQNVGRFPDVSRQNR